MTTMKMMAMQNEIAGRDNRGRLGVWNVFKIRER
jgi:hypothetical protein